MAVVTSQMTSCANALRIDAKIKFLLRCINILLFVEMGPELACSAEVKAMGVALKLHLAYHTAGQVTDIQMMGTKVKLTWPLSAFLNYIRRVAMGTLFWPLLYNLWPIKLLPTRGITTSEKPIGQTLHKKKMK